MNKMVALITGSSRGTGRAIAMQLAQDGYDIAFCYLRARTEDARRAIEAVNPLSFALEATTSRPQAF